MAKRRARLTDENDPLTSTDSVLTSYEQVSKSTSQQENKQSKHEDNQAISQPDNITSQEARKMEIRKSTFQISKLVLQQLDTLHLQLQLELGKANAPYKEVIVEEAIARFLEQVNRNKDELLASLLERQRQRF